MNKEQAERYIKKYMPKTYNRVKDLQSQLAYAQSRIEDGALMIKGYQEELDKANARIKELEAKLPEKQKGKSKWTEVKN